MADPLRHPSGIAAADAVVYRDAIAAFDARRFEDAVRALTGIVARPGVAGVLGRYYLAQAHFELGRRCLQTRRFADAARHFEQSRNHNPQTRGLLDLLALALCGEGRHARAVETLELAAAHAAPETLRALRLAYANWRAGRPAAAESVLRDAARAQPHIADFPLHLGLLAAQRSAYEESIAHLAEAVALDPSRPDAHRRLALALASAGRMNDAAQSLADALRLRPRDAGLARELTLALQCCDAPLAAAISARLPEHSAPIAGAPAAEPILRLTEAFAREPELIGAFLDIPAGARDADVLGAIAPAVEAAADRVPGYADLHLYRSRLLARTGRAEAALAAVERGLAINPGFLAARIHRADLLAALHRITDAIGELDGVIGDGGDFADVHYRLAELHRCAGRLEEARASYVRALKLNADYAHARQALEALPAA